MLNTEKDFVGYQGICSQKGIYIEKDQAFDYVMDQINTDSTLKAEFKKTMETWYFSGDFIKVYREDKEENEWLES